VQRFLVDTSAWARYPTRLDELSAAGLAVTCGIVELQLLGAVTDPETYATVARLRRAAFESLEMTDADVRRALDVQALLAGQRVPGSALLVAAVAERHGLPLLHCDPCQDLIARVTGQVAVEVGDPTTGCTA
jgi:predicted nucleic acid-binding protein